jgi:hypothetical protein
VTRQRQSRRERGSMTDATIPAQGARHVFGD